MRLAVSALSLLLAGSAMLTGSSALAADPAETGPVPVRVRLIKGSRQGPASLPPAMAPLKQQLSKLAYQRWEQLSELDFTMTVKKTEFVELPNGEHVALTVQETNGRNVTIEVALAQRNTQSRLTIEKGQRIVHQVSGEKGGVAYFVTVHAWPAGP
jgi:hypothetical protein